jgi:hypothetical protein
MTSLTDYQAAKSRVERFMKGENFTGIYNYDIGNIIRLRADLNLIAEHEVGQMPSVEEVARVIAMFSIYEEDFGPDNEVFADIVPTGGAELGECPTPIQRLAVAVQALYRSKTA